MITKLAVFAAAFAFNLMVLRVVRPLAQRFAWLDHPDSSRKRHEVAVPVIGGPALLLTMLSFGVFMLISMPSMLTWECLWVLLGGVMIAILGWLDDQYDLRVRIRLLGQMAALLVLTLGSGVTLVSLGDLLGFGELRLGWLAVPVTVIAGVGLINAFNMIDGMDGLAAGLGLVTLSFLYGLLILQGVKPSPLLLVMMAGLLGFLACNCQWPGFRGYYMFLGDSGSMLIGYFVVVAMVYYSQHAPNIIYPVNALWLVAIPLLDLFTAMLRRLVNGRSPWQADRRHIHHSLLRLGIKPLTVVLILIGMAVCFASIGLYAQLANVKESTMFFSALLVFVIVLMVIINLQRFYRLIRNHINQKRLRWL